MGKPVAISEVEPGLRAAFEKVGSARQLALALGIKPQSIACWRRVPADRVREVNRVTKVPLKTLRPDLYR